MPAPAQRLTFVSDPTVEFPNNKNNSFKVRLPSRLTLPGQNWYASLWSVSVPDGALPTNIFPGVATSKMAVKMNHGIVRLDPPKTNDKFTSETTSGVTFQASLKEVMDNDVRTGVDFWRSAMALISKKKAEYQAYLGGFYPNSKILIPAKQETQWKWNGENLQLLQESKAIVGLESIEILKEVAEVFGLVTKQTSGSYELGPNIFPSYPTTTFVPADEMDSAIVDDSLAGDISNFIKPWPSSITSKKLWRIDGDYLCLSTLVNWTFTLLNNSFEAAQNTLETVMVYSDLIQSTVVGSGWFPLLRQLILPRDRKGRVSVEPFHREWIPLRGNTIELVEIELATNSGPLTQLTPGKTLVTIGLQQL